MLNPYQSYSEDQLSGSSSSEEQFIMVGKKTKDSSFKQNSQRARILQKCLILVSHLPQWFSDPKIIQKQILFGRYGNIKSVIISSNHTSYKKKKTREVNQVQAYITYENDFDASLAIKALNGYKIGTRQITATYGTNKYCTSLDTKSKCKVSNCYFIHQKKESDQVAIIGSIGQQRQQQTASKIIKSNLQYFVKKINADNLNSRQARVFPTRIQSHTKFIVFPSVKEVIDDMIINGLILKYKFQQARETVQIEEKTTKKSLSDTTKRIQYYRIRSKTQKTSEIPQKKTEEKSANQKVQQSSDTLEIKRSCSNNESTLNKKCQKTQTQKIEQPKLQNLVLKSILQEKQSPIVFGKKIIPYKKKYVRKSVIELTFSKKLPQIKEPKQFSQNQYLKLFQKPFLIENDQINQCQSIQDTTTGSSNSTSRQKEMRKDSDKSLEFQKVPNLKKDKKQNSQKVLKTSSRNFLQSPQDSYLVTKVTREIMKNTILKRSKVYPNNNDVCKVNAETQKQWKHVTQLMINCLLGSKSTAKRC